MCACACAHMCVHVCVCAHACVCTCVWAHVSRHHSPLLLRPPGTAPQCPSQQSPVPRRIPEYFSDSPRPAHIPLSWDPPLRPCPARPQSPECRLMPLAFFHFRSFQCFQSGRGEIPNHVFMRLFFFSLFLFLAIRAAYGSAWVRDQIQATAATAAPRQHCILSSRDFAATPGTG